MKNQSPYDEIPFAKKLNFLLFAITYYANTDGGWDGICVVFRSWANIRNWWNVKYMFPELWEEIQKAIKKTKGDSIINYSDGYSKKGRIRLLTRVHAQLTK